MDQLFTKYERELVMLRSLCREYAQRYPKVAAKLQLGGETCDDPHVERLIQAVALLCARVTKRLDDSYPQLTEALLNLLYPHYLRSFPSCAIVCFTARSAGGPPTAMPDVARGTLLETAPVHDVQCQFATVYAVAPTALALTQARFQTIIDAPIATRLDAQVTSSISLVFQAALPGTPRPADQAAPLRLYIDGDAGFCATLRDVLFMHTVGAYLQIDDDGRWQPLPAVPVKTAGFADDQALLPFDARLHAAYRLLAEYFAFPEKFNFIEVDVAAILDHLPVGCARFTLHLAVAQLSADSDTANLLASLSSDHLVMGCTPVVNLFRKPGVPITYDQFSADYTLLADSAFPQGFEVYSVDRVHMVRQSAADTSVTEFRPFYSLRHGEDDGAAKGRYWLLRHDDTLAICNPGHEKSITLVNADCAPLEIERNVLSVELTCSNRDLPCAIKLGSPAGDLFIPGAARGDPIRFLRRPTRPARLAHGPDTQWRLISHLALNHHALMQEGANGLREMLTLYDVAQSPVSRRQINGITALDAGPTTAWMRHRRGTSLAHGMEVRVTLDEQAFVGAGLHLFIQMLDQFFALYVQLNSFIELVILSQHSGKELFRCQPRSGSMTLI